jgi:hypothetical protein
MGCIHEGHELATVSEIVQAGWLTPTVGRW